MIGESRTLAESRRKSKALRYSGSCIGPVLHGCLWDFPFNRLPKSLRKAIAIGKGHWLAILHKSCGDPTFSGRCPFPRRRPHRHRYR